jgi:hypothetical protein
MWRPPFVPQGKALIDVAPSPHLLFQCPGLSATDEITSFVMLFGLLFIASDSGSDVKVFSFDGQTVTLQDTITGKDTGILGTNRGEVFCASNAHSLRKRAWDGTWSDVTIPAAVTSFVPRQVLEYKSNLYFAGADGAGATGILALEVFDDKLCYLYEDEGEILAWDGAALTVARSITVVSATFSQYTILGTGIGTASPANGPWVLGSFNAGGSPSNLDVNEDFKWLEFGGTSVGSAGDTGGVFFQSTDALFPGNAKAVYFQEDTAGQISPTIIHTWAGSGRIHRGMCDNTVSPSVQYFRTTDDSGNEGFGSYDGTTFTEQHYTFAAGDTPKNLGRFFYALGEVYHVERFVNAGTHTIQIFRLTNTTARVVNWTDADFVTAGGYDNVNQARGILDGIGDDIGGKFYLYRQGQAFFADDSDLWEFDGTSLTLARGPFGSADSGCTAISMDGVLYYGTGDAGGTWNVGKFTPPSTWNDAYATLSGLAGVGGYAHIVSDGDSSGAIVDDVFYHANDSYTLKIDAVNAAQAGDQISSTDLSSMVTDHQHNTTTKNLFVAGLLHGPSTS